ncbi:hypothetical protein [Actinophytocola oryzae]|uniref:Uncharacterized protein n=1 Tax=Actinophytocola oryzae TaxID=502181 RepID=A0A4V3FRM7_9PSEU|nr:hypothetical protein [Actinophytocola oryzae]TDV44191.1 hypothetical protein CLV71_114100 [Actinophytocola oryzae]
MLDHDGSQILIIGPAIWRFSDAWSPAQPILAVTLAGGNTVLDNTVHLTWTDLIGARARLLTPEHDVPVALTTALFNRLEPGNVLENLARQHWSGLAAAPLLLLGRSAATITAHTLVRLGEHDGLFIRVGELTHNGGLVDVVKILPTVLTITSEDREFFNNHQCCYQKWWPDVEFEHKITMLGPVDLHAVTVGLRNLVGTEHLPGTIWDYRDDYQLWDFNNHLFEVTSPSPEAGYISFIPDSAGTVIVKRKWFTRDSLRRRESRWRGVRIPRTVDSFEDYARSHVDGDIRFLGSFRRTRFDSTCEFTKTGNVYGFMVDWCRPLDRPDAPHLYQVEVEYLHSRTRDETARHTVETELLTIRNAAAAYLDRAGIAHRPGESKLTYLRSLTVAEEQ